MGIPLNYIGQDEIFNSLATIRLLKQSMNQDRLPSKLGHFFVLINAFSFPLDKPLITALSFCVNIVKLVTIPLFIKFPQKKERFIYRTLRLVLDPLSVLAHVAAMMIRIASSVLGMVSPRLAVKGWILAEIIQSSTYRVAVNLQKTLKIKHRSEEPAILTPDQILKNRSLIKPRNAFNYLGETICLSIENEQKNIDIQNGLEADAKQKCGELLTYIQLNSQELFDLKFRLSNPSEKPLYILPLLNRLQPIDQPEANIAEQSKQSLTVDQILELVNYIDSHLFNELTSQQAEIAIKMAELTKVCSEYSRFGTMSGVMEIPMF